MRLGTHLGAACTDLSSDVQNTNTRRQQERRTHDEKTSKTVKITRDGERHKRQTDRSVKTKQIEIQDAKTRRAADTRSRESPAVREGKQPPSEATAGYT